MEILLKALLLGVVIMDGNCISDDEPKNLTIGAIFYENSEDLISALEISAEEFNFNVSIKLVSKRGKILEVSKHVCALAEEMVIGIIDGTGGRTSENIQALTDMLELPHLILQHNDLLTTNWSVLNMFPSPESYNEMLEDLIAVKDWNNFTLLYVQGHSLVQVTKLMKMGNDTDRPTFTVRELAGNDYRDVLINSKESGYTNFVLVCPSVYIERLLLQAQQVGLMADEHSYIILSPDLFTLDLDRYRYGGVNMTGFRITDTNQNSPLWSFTARFNAKTDRKLLPEQLKTELLLINDAVQIFARTVYVKVNVTAMPLSCEKFETWSYGSTLLNFMKTNKINGITNNIKFDGLGQRTDITFDILEMTPAGNQTIGKWEKRNLTMTWPFVASAEIGEESIMSNKTLKVLISLTEPYGYLKESAVQLTGNDRYEGFTIDLIQKLSEILGFSYEFEVETDYGGWDNITKKWTGMIAKIRDEKADLGICDFTITAERQKGIDFSMPFMTLGISILYREPSKQPPEMFSFMAVFSKEVWYYMMFIQLGLGAIMIFVGRISQKEWQNPIPCIQQPEELTNQFSFANAVWLIIGSVMQQGSEIAPIAIAPRTITSMWWFFTMVMVASYTGTLVAFLTVESNDMPFKSAKELNNQKSISYGAKDTGSTINFFRDSKDPVYQEMYKTMIQKKWLVTKNNDGVKLAESKNYAFFSESTSIEYYQERHCDLLMVGGLLDSKSYGIGMQKNSSYKVYIDQALLHLKEKGVIQKLKDLWWKEKRGGGQCEDVHSEEAQQLGMKNMIGAFVVLGVGCLIGLLISTLDMLWGVFKKSVKYRTTFKYELIEELKFVLKFSGDIKPVRRPPKFGDQSSSVEALAIDEGKDEIRSLRSIRSGRSTDTHRTCHSHGSKHSRHSPNDLSVAFARRREYT